MTVVKPIINPRPPAIRHRAVPHGRHCLLGNGTPLG